MPFPAGAKSPESPKRCGQSAVSSASEPILPFGPSRSSPLRAGIFLISRTRRPSARFSIEIVTLSSNRSARRAFEIVGDESDRPALVTFDLDASQRDRQLGIALAGEHDIGIGDDFKAVADGLAYVPGLRLAQTRVHLDARDEESVGGVDLLPPAKVIIAFVENVGCTGFELGLTADLHVIDGRGRNLDATRDIVARMIDDVHLHAADTTIPFGPFAHLAQRHRARVDQPNHLGAFRSRVSIGLL